MKRDEIERIALANGFKLKQQPDGSMALNPYVFEFASALLSVQQSEIDRLKMEVASMKEASEALAVELARAAGSILMKCNKKPAEAG